MDALLELIRLWVGTVIYRPYVYGFFVCYLLFSWRQFKARDWAIYSVLAYLIAFACEYSATRNGFPFGLYVYIDETRTRELWISNVPFWDSLSFVFLSYFSWMVAASALGARDMERALLKPSSALLGGCLMMLLDVVIDPLTLLGDRWFLGRIYYYPNGGSYFGVTISNFVGWFFVGTVTILAFQYLARIGVVRPARWKSLSPRESLGTLGVYAGVFLFNLGITAWIGEWQLFLASSTVALSTLAFCVWMTFRSEPERALS